MKVFIAEDSEYVCDLLTEMMSEVPGLKVVGQSKDALLATESIRRLRPDVVILDLGLARGSGLGVLATIKKESSVPIVIVLSGQDDQRDRKKCVTLGADYFFEKTDGFQKVIEVLRTLVAEDEGTKNGASIGR